MLLAAKYVLPVATLHIVDGAVLVRDDRIVEIGKLTELRERHPDEEVRDFGLAALIPGFVDLHTHLEYSTMRGLVDDLPYSEWKMQVKQREQFLSAEDWQDAAYLGVLEAIRSGITTVADITETGASVGAIAESKLRAFIYREVSTMVKSQVDDVMTGAVADIDRWSSATDPSLVTVGIAPHSAYTCHPEIFARTAALANERGLPVSMHLAGSREEYDFVKYGSSKLAVDYRELYGGGEPGWMPTGVSPVRYVQQWGLLSVPNLLAVHCTQVDDADIDVLASHDVAVAFCPRCNAKLGMGALQLRKMLGKGIRVGIGTDSPASNNTLDMFDEMRIGLLIQRAIDEHSQFHVAPKFVKLATLDAAHALGIDEKVGSLEPGKQADIVAVDLSHSHQIPTRHPFSTLVHTANQENVLFTMIAGQVLYDDGMFGTLDSERIVARADEVRDKLRA